MSKFNATTTRKTTNKSGHVAYSMGDKEKLVTQVLTTFFNESKFYGDNSSELVKLAESLAITEPQFVSNLARYARKEMHLRSVSHVLTCIVAHTVESKPFIKSTVADVVERADDITEIASCYLSMYGKPFPNGLKKALSDALRKFNAYQISKYNGGNKTLKFKDVLRICHPTPKTIDEDKLFGAIINDTLPVATRWETELSANGNNAETWEKLIAENKIGYMAMLRNLRNIINANPKNIDVVYSKLANRDEVLKSKQLPFRFLSAYREMPTKAYSKAYDVLETAIEYSCENLPKLYGKTVIAIDVSGSMSSTISAKSNVRCSDISCLLGVIASRICDDFVVYTFDDELYHPRITHRSPILETTMRINKCGGGTNLKLPLNKMIHDNIYADRLIILSDNEINHGWYGRYSKTCQTLADSYRNTINPNLWVHAIDLQGYGTQQFIGGKTNIIAGWSERVLEFIALAENGIDTQVQKIENYKVA